MDFRQLESFVTIAKVKNFSQAAEKLFLTQPALSNHISKLENELGITLFERNNKRTELTPAGKVFFISAQAMLNQRESAILDLNDYKGKIEGMLEIGTSSVPGQYLLPDILKNFNGRYPCVVYNIHYLNSKQVIASILSGEMDFGIVGVNPNNSLLTSERIAEDVLVVIAPNKPPFDVMESISAEELLRYRLLSRQEGSGTRQVFENALNQHFNEKVQLKTVAYIDNNEMIYICVKRGLGISVVSSLAVADKASVGQLKILPISNLQINRSFYFVYPKSRTLSPLVKCFKEFVFDNKS